MANTQANDAGWDAIIQGDVFTAIANAHISVTGDFFWAFMVNLPLFIMYIKNETFLTPTISIILLGPIVIAFTPLSVRFILNLIVIFGISIILYKAAI